MAGVGEADVLAPEAGEDYRLEDVFATMRQRLDKRRPSLRYYGGLRFHPGVPRTELWKAFRDYRFIVPRFEVVRRMDGTFFAINVRPAAYASADDALVAVAEQLHAITPEPAAAPVTLPAVVRRHDNPDRRGWERLVRSALDAFEKTGLRKVVLARETHFTMAGALNPVDLLTQLSRRSVNAFEFCFHPTPDRAFIGASPERLYKRVSTYLQSEAIAGTRPRGRSDKADRQFAQKLLDSDKERREHAFVVDMLRSHFEQLCEAMYCEETPGILRLRNCQHLCTRMEGLLRDPHADAALLHALHPTPAVGGEPRPLALRWLEEHEPFDRGIYASPTGWVGANGAEFCVAIRSGLVLGGRLVLYNGAGIVPGADPAEEWDEIQSKMGNFLSVLTGV